MSFAPTLGPIVRFNGVAGQFSLNVAVTYPDDLPTTVVFTSSTYGAPIVICTATNPGGTFVHQPERFGDALTEQWVRNFFDPR